MRIKHIEMIQSQRKRRLLRALTKTEYQTTTVKTGLRSKHEQSDRDLWSFLSG